MLIVINTVEARVLFTLRHDCASLLCEARGLSKCRHRIEVSTGTVVRRHGYTERNVYAAPKLYGRDTMGFMREARVCVVRRVTVGFM